MHRITFCKYMCGWVVAKIVNLVVFSCLIWCVCTVHARFVLCRFSLKWPSMPTQNDRLHNARYDTRAFLLLTHSFRSFCFLLLFAFQPIYCKRAPCCIYIPFHLMKLKKKNRTKHTTSVSTYRLACLINAKCSTVLS